MSQSAQTAEGSPHVTALDRGWERLDRWINPILVKDLRSWMRSKRFVTVFFLVMVASELLLLSELSRLSGGGRQGINLFDLLLGELVVVLLGVVPWFTYRAFELEVRSRTTELMMLSRLVPSDLLQAKLLTGLAMALLLFAAVSPSLSIAYLLGGVSPFYALSTLLGLFLGGAVVTSSVLLVGSIFQHWVMRRLAVLAVAFGALLLAFVVGATLVKGSSLRTGDRMAVALIGIFLLSLTLHFLYRVATARLSFMADDRDSAPRFALTLLCIGLLGAGILLDLISPGHAGLDRNDVSNIALVFTSTTVTFCVGALLLLNTAERPSERVGRAWPRSLFLALFYRPGKGRLVAWLLLHLFTLLLLGLLLTEVLASTPIVSSLGWAAASSIDGVVARAEDMTWMLAVTPLAGLAWLTVSLYLEHLIKPYPVLSFLSPPRAPTAAEIGVGWVVLGSLPSFVFGMHWALNLLSPWQLAVAMTLRAASRTEAPELALEDGAGFAVLMMLLVLGLSHSLSLIRQAYVEDRQIRAELLAGGAHSPTRPTEASHA